MMKLDESQARAFRMRQTHLAGPGAPGLAAAARSILGAQAQQEAPALFGLSLRTAGRPDAVQVQAALRGALDPELVRTWGQRDTLHIYDTQDWPIFSAAQQSFPQTGRRGAIPTDDELAAARKMFIQSGKPLTNVDLYSVISARHLDEAGQHPSSPKSPERFAASRLVWSLAHQGDVCLADKVGNEHSYVARVCRFPSLKWNDSYDADTAATMLMRRYLASFAPATPADIAHFFGARVVDVRRWLAPLESDLVKIHCGDRKGLIALAESLDSLQRSGSELANYPARLLPMYDGQLMTHKDKSWITPDESDRPLVWRKAAVLAATVVDRGQIVATWTTKVLAKTIVFTIEPLSGWRPELLDEIQADARAYADHLGLSDRELHVDF